MAVFGLENRIIHQLLRPLVRLDASTVLGLKALRIPGNRLQFVYERLKKADSGISEASTKTGEFANRVDKLASRIDELSNGDSQQKLL